MSSDSRHSRPTAMRMHPLSGAIALAVGSITITGIGKPVMAAEGLYDEVVATATRRETSVQDIPYNIAAVGAEQIEKEGITNVVELARIVPGLIAIEQGRRNPSPTIMRGISVDALAQSEAQGNDNGGAVATYVGEIPVYIDLLPVDLERVEVLIGPQGTLYGAGSLAGAIRYIPARPDYDAFSAKVRGKVYGMAESDDGSFDLEGTLNLPISENLAFRGSLGYLDEAGFVDQHYLVREPGVSSPEPDFTDPADVEANLRAEEDTNTTEILFARAALAWQATDEIEGIFTYTYQNQDSGGRQINHAPSLQVIEDAQGVDIPNGFYSNGHRVLEPDERTNHILNLDVIVDLGFAELTSATGYIDFDEESQRDQTDLLLTFGFTYADFPEFTAFTTDPQEEQTFTQELRLVSTGDGPLNWIAGFFYSDSELDALSLEFTPNLYQFAGFAEVPQVVQRFGNNVEYIQISDEELTEWALFGEIGFQITDQWQVTGGIRYFDVENTVSDGIGFPFFNQVLAIDPNDATQQVWLNETTATQDIDDTIFKFNTSYNFSDDVMAYFTFSQGYRNGGTNGIQDCASIPAPNPNVVCGNANQLAYGPDTTDNYEVGLRTTLADGAITANLAVFFVEWDDVQVADVSDGGTFPIIVNGDTAESEGLEALLKASLSENWYLTMAYTFTDTELSSPAPLLENGTASDGDRLPGTPEHAGSFRLDYTAPISAELDLTAGYGFNFQSDVYTKLGVGGECCRPDDGSTRPGPGEVLGGYAIHNVQVGVEADQWSARLFVNNLFDKEAVTGVRTDPSFIGRAGFGADYALRRYFNYILTPRSVGVDFTYKFD